MAPPVTPSLAAKQTALRLASHALHHIACGNALYLVRDRRLGLRRVGRVLLDAADEIERGMKRLVILRIRRDIRLRAGLLGAFGLEVSAQRSLTARVGSGLEPGRHLLQHLDVGRATLRRDAS